MKTIYKQNRTFKLICVILCFVFCIWVFTLFSTSAFSHKKSTIIVSLGDSFSSGEGIPPFYGQDGTPENKVNNYDWLSHRSQKSWPGQLTLWGVSGKMSENRNTNWYFAATAGATTEHLTKSFRKDYNVSGQIGYKDIPPQLDIFKKLEGKKADYVTITIGGNDADFQNLVTDAVAATLNPEVLDIRLNMVWEEFFRSGGTRDKLRKAYTDISRIAGPQAKIIVAGYPKLLDQQGKGIFFTKETATLLNKSISKFNDEIEAVVKACKKDGMQVYFVSVEEAFSGHEAYSDDPYLNPVMFKQSEELFPVIVSSYSIHPNEKGAGIYAKCVQEMIDKLEEEKSTLPRKKKITDYFKISF